MLLKIANPIANETTSKRILKMVLKINKEEKLISGIKACTKIISDKNNKNKILVINGTVNPMDLITHIPIVCEENDIPYIFVDDPKWILDKTCVIIENVDDEKFNKIINHCNNKL